MGGSGTAQVLFEEAAAGVGLVVVPEVFGAGVEVPADDDVVVVAGEVGTEFDKVVDHGVGREGGR